MFPPTSTVVSKLQRLVGCTAEIKMKIKHLGPSVSLFHRLIPNLGAEKRPKYTKRDGDGAWLSFGQICEIEFSAPSWVQQPPCQYDSTSRGGIKTVLEPAYLLLDPDL